MCGIAGFIDRSARAGSYDFFSTARAMADAIAYRGPDDFGIWLDDEAGAAFSHRRLSVVELSSAGHQPMVSSCGRYVINYNGEIYNYDDCRRQFEGRDVCLKGHSDTELILELCAAFGIVPTLKSLIGMFALAIWDRQTRTMVLARDRLGIKPLYWGHWGKLFLFGSELKALRAHNGWTPALDPVAASSFLQFAYVPAPRSIYCGIQKLEPGCILTVGQDRAPKLEHFWDAREVVAEALGNRLALSDSEATDQLEALLKDAVRRCMVADVPIGAFLSGGTDSSTVAALMQAQSARPIRTFTIGFADEDFDEAPHARAVARHLGTDHTELYARPEDALAVIPRLPELYDEPLADASQIPTCLIAQLTRREVTVALSGDGGDELFAGYNRYMFADTVWSKAQRVPLALRKLAASAVTAISQPRWDRLRRMLPARMAPNQLGEKMHKASAALAIDDPDALYRRLVSRWNAPEPAWRDAPASEGVLWDRSIRQWAPHPVERMQFLDLVTYLPDDILTKLDRASMAVGLEARVPLLDHRVVEFAFRLPHRLKRRGGEDKWLLRQVLYRHVPQHLMRRPKMGFAVPLAAWLRGPLREWADALLDSERLDESLDAATIRAVWDQHLRGTRNFSEELWSVLMLQAWRERWL